MYADPRPIKKLGQHWLRDPLTIQKMVQSLEPRPTDLVVEIGPGTGVITKHLASEAGEVIAYEVDQDLVTKLQEDLHYAKNVKITQQNILAQELELPKRNYKVIGSLPYYITSPILEKLLTADPPASTIVLMIQKEVADKILSLSPNSSFLSNFVRIFGQVELVGYVRPGAFFPPPQVTSAIIRIKTFPKSELPRSDIEQFILLLHAGFTEPRKQLHNSLASGLHIETKAAKDLLRKANINSERRAETLSLPEWTALYTVVKEA